MAIFPGKVRFIRGGEAPVYMLVYGGIYIGCEVYILVYGIYVGIRWNINWVHGIYIGIW